MASEVGRLTASILTNFLVAVRISSRDRLIIDPLNPIHLLLSAKRSRVNSLPIHTEATSMRINPSRIMPLLFVGLLGLVPLHAEGQTKSNGARNVLVELYTSQGCDSCPSACDLLGKLPKLGFSPDRVIALNFHVDYFNTPWVDPFSDPSFSDREMSYNQVMKRKDLYFTPMLMVDGRYPMLGSNQGQVVSAIRQAKTEAPGVGIELAAEGVGPRKTVKVQLQAKSADVAGRDLLVGVALTQNRVSTAVPSGENKGKTLVEYHVVRKLDHKFTKLSRSELKTLTFSLNLPPNADPADFRVVAFAQDRNNGQVHQVDDLPWQSASTPASDSAPAPDSTPAPTRTTSR